MGGGVGEILVRTPMPVEVSLYEESMEKSIAKHNIK